MMTPVQRAKRANTRRMKHPPSPFVRLRQFGKKRLRGFLEGGIGRLESVRFLESDQ